VGRTTTGGVVLTGTQVDEKGIPSVLGIEPDWGQKFGLGFLTVVLAGLGLLFVASHPSQRFVAKSRRPSTRDSASLLLEIPTVFLVVLP